MKAVGEGGVSNSITGLLEEISEGRTPPAINE